MGKMRILHVTYAHACFWVCPMFYPSLALEPKDVANYVVGGIGRSLIRLGRVSSYDLHIGFGRLLRRPLFLDDCSDCSPITTPYYYSYDCSYRYPYDCCSDGYSPLYEYYSLNHAYHYLFPQTTTPPIRFLPLHPFAFLPPPPPPFTFLLPFTFPPTTLILPSPYSPFPHICYFRLLLL